MVARNWVGGASGNWNVGGNWDPAAVPTGVDTAAIDRTGGAIVTGDVNIACAAIYIGATQAANVLRVQNDIDVPIVEVGPTAGSYIEFDGFTVGPIDVELDEFDVRIASGCRFKGTVNFHGPSYSAPMDIQAAAPARGPDWRVFDATADVKMWWVIDNLSTLFVWAAGAKLRAVRGCQFLALTDNQPELHVGATRYKFVGDWSKMNHFSGGRYSEKNRSKNVTKVSHQGSMGAGIAWSGNIVDATYKFLKDELQYWCDEGTEVVVITRDRAITGFITNFHWRPAGVGADPDAFEYDIEIVEGG